METFRGKTVIIARPKSWELIDETNKYSLKQRLKCKFKAGPSAYELLQKNPNLRLAELSKMGVLCNLYPFDVGMEVIKMFNPKRWLDPTAGWGDRLRIAIASGVEYVGVDSNKSMREAYDAIIMDKAGGDTKKYKVITGKFQDAPITGKFDLVFTSPPFFTLEVYENMTEWKNIEAFMEDFLRPLLKKSNDHLKKGGHIVLYIEDRPETEFIDLMKEYVKDELPKLQYEGAFYYQSEKLRTYYVWKKI
jgi:tRNA G10  N-methylase Trm11